ncbi:hypothetical protein [Azohydromonas caseinilytica]|uniref:Uncharacterized protein n=1 Tax=Azohydromonas caseinilytica TaxID=2728836 RepID=A0A848FFB2_9BURK|nr:hypothetical protein [Azohydromonas caseinilytica]NML16840.1 hypothetical protein [Azohydromonas caseinilytica]
MTALPRTFPAGAVECRPGDHLVRREADARCRVYRVRDIVALERLLPSLTRPVALTAEADLLDSMAPAYAGEVHLLLDALEPAFESAEAAVQAIQAGSLGAGEPGLLRPAGDFPAARTQVVGSSTGHPA